MEFIVEIATSSNVTTTSVTIDNETEEIPSENDINDELVDTYQYNIIANNAFQPISPNGQQFAMLDCDKNGVLKRRQCVIVQRESVETENSSEWLYSCSCNSKSNPLIRSILPSTTNILDLQKLYCIHAKCICQLLKHFDVIHQIVPANTQTEDHSYCKSVNSAEHTTFDSINDIDIFPIHILREQSFCVKTSRPSSLGIVTLRNKTITCVMCPSYTNHKCMHAVHAKKVISQLEDQDTLSVPPDIPDWLVELHRDINEVGETNAYHAETFTCLSNDPILYTPPESLKRKLSDNLHGISVDEGKLLLKPEYTNCKQCGETLDVAKQELKIKDVVFPLSLRQAQVYSFVCMCGFHNEYEGGRDGLLHMPSYLISHTVLRSYLHGICKMGNTIFGHYSYLVGQFRDRGQNLSQILSYYKFKAAWYNFLHLLKPPFGNFICPKCGNEPSIIVCDATTLSIQKNRFNFNVQLDPKDNREWKKGSRLEYYTYLPNKRHREALKELVDGVPVKGYVSHLNKLPTQALRDFLFCIRTMDNDLIGINAEYKDFVKALATPSPISSYMPCSDIFKRILDKYRNGDKIVECVDDMAYLHMHFPLLHCIMSRQLTLQIPDFELYTLLQELLDVQENSLTIADLGDINSAYQPSEIEPHSHFPVLPIIREKQRYDVDKSHSSHYCTKKSQGKHHSLMPGLFSILCPHGICYGYELMECAESPRIPFNILLRRFKTAPNFVVYDNACHLHVYALRREPHFFKHTRFVVDKFHWRNHKGCSAGYNINIYGGDIGEINSQVLEQYHRDIKKLKSSLPYMTSHNFCNHMKLYVSEYNCKKCKTFNC